MLCAILKDQKVHFLKKRNKYFCILDKIVIKIIDFKDAV